MKVSLFTLALPLACATTISYDTGYDDASRSLNAVACSDGPNGLERYGWSTQGQLPGFPFIGGSDTIAGWNSQSCGQCFEVSYAGKTIHVLAVDHAGAGLNVAQKAMDTLTGGQAVFLGRIDAAVALVGSDKCGLVGRRAVEFEA